MATFLEDGTSFVYRGVDNSRSSRIQEVLLKLEEEKKSTRKNQQVPNMDPKPNSDIGPKDEAMSGERQKSRVLIVGGDEPNPMAISQLLP